MVNARCGCLLLATALLVPGATSIAQDADADDDAVVGDELAWAEDVDPIVPVVRGIDPAADRILRAMSEFHAGVDAFTFTLEVAEDVLLPHGQMISYGGVAEVAVQRPGSLNTRFRGEQRNSRVIFHNGRCTLYNINTDVYAVAEVPKVLGDAIDTAIERYGLNIPAADIIYEDPYAELTAAVDYGYVVGKTSIEGVECHHLAFAQETIDWQAWIQVGPRPLLRKLVITYKDEPASPNYTAYLRDWDLASDPGETKDRAAEFPDRVRSLAAAWEAYAKDNGVIRPDKPIVYGRPVTRGKY